MCHSLGVKPLPQSAAFFDLDNTLIKGSSLFYLFKGLVEYGQVSKRQILDFAFENYRFIRSKTEHVSSMSRISSKALTLVAGRNHAHLSELCEKIVEKFLNQKLNPQVYERLQEHHFLGHHTWLITAAPVEIAQIVAQKMGMTGAIGTHCEVIDGKYSGRLLGEMLHGPRKAVAMQSIAVNRNYDLTRSFAYSDSINDLPLLLSVGTPFVVNPNQELARIARKNSWSELTNVS